MAIPLNQQHITGELRQRVDQLWAEREQFFAVLQALPQVVSHYDSHRRNLLTRQRNEGRMEVVAIDWGAFGIGPLGFEVVQLVGASAFMSEWPTAQVRELERVAYANYPQGLAEAGWSGDKEIVRLGYVAAMAAKWGCSFPSVTSVWCSPGRRARAIQFFGAAEEELYELWLPMLSYTLECADEARLLMRKLGKG